MSSPITLPVSVGAVPNGTIVSLTKGDTAITGPLSRNFVHGAFIAVKPSEGPVIRDFVADGFVLTVAPTPEPTVPTVPGLYNDNATDLWLLTPSGDWHLIGQDGDIEDDDVIADVDAIGPIEYLPMTAVLTFDKEN